MLKVYIIKHYVSINNDKWYLVGNTKVKMLEDAQPTEVIIDKGSFEEWCEFLQKNYLDGISYQTTLFRKKPCIVTYEWSWDSYEKYTHFDTLSYKIVYKEMPDVSLNYIMREFPADQCIQYLKERGLTACPIMK